MQNISYNKEFNGHRVMSFFSEISSQTYRYFSQCIKNNKTIIPTLQISNLVYIKAKQPIQFK